MLLEARESHLDQATRERLQHHGADELDALIVRAVCIEALEELFEIRSRPMTE